MGDRIGITKTCARDLWILPYSIKSWARFSYLDEHLIITDPECYADTAHAIAGTKVTLCTTDLVPQCAQVEDPYMRQQCVKMYTDLFLQDTPTAEAVWIDSDMILERPIPVNWTGFARVAAEAMPSGILAQWRNRYWPAERRVWCDAVLDEVAYMWRGGGWLTSPNAWRLLREQLEDDHGYPLPDLLNMWDPEAFSEFQAYGRFLEFAGLQTLPISTVDVYPSPMTWTFSGRAIPTQRDRTRLELATKPIFHHEMC